MFINFKWVYRGDIFLGYDIQQVCLNGHQMTDSFTRYSAHRRDFCSTCGEKTIIACLSCKAKIQGHYYATGVISMRNAPVPDYCEGCGNAFPWTSNQKNSPKVILADAVEIIKNICAKFHIFARQLQSRYNDRATIDIADEYDVQDLLHAVLRLHFKDVRAEDPMPTKAGASSRVDFLIHDENIAIEVKKTNPKLKAKEIGEQIAIDIQRYQANVNCKYLICFVYDPEGKIANPVGLENDLSKLHGNLNVIVIVCPKGH